MENDGTANRQATENTDLSQSSVNFQAKEQAATSKKTNQKSRQGEDKKWTLRQHWDRASSPKRLKWIFEGIGVLIAFLILLNYVWQNLQTKWDFAIEHRPRVYLSGTVRTMVVRVAPDPDERVLIIGFVPLKNFGNSPALHFIGAGEVIPGNGPDLEKKADDWFAAIGLPLKKNFDPSIGMWIMENGIGESESTVMQGQGTNFSIGQNKEISVLPKLPAVLVVRIQYEDASGNLYSTDVCRYIAAVTNPGNTPSTLAVLCAGHNEVH